MEQGGEVMISFEPLIYTRTKNVDYRFVATPQALKGSRCWDFVEHHIRMVLADEGSRGPLLGRRWHIMSIDGYLLIGIATYEFERLDYTGCPIRGYYGILLKSVVEVMPSLELFRQLDRTFVDPIFNDIYASGSTWEDNVESIAFLGQNGSVSHESPIDFNHDEKCVRFFDDFVISYFVTGNGVSNISIIVYTMSKRINPSINALSTLIILIISTFLLLSNVLPAVLQKKNRKNLLNAE